MKNLALLCAVAVLVLPSGGSAQRPLPLQHTPRSTTPAITAADLMTRLYVLADDSMLGRRAGERGNLEATAYIEREVRRLGLVPAGDPGSYFQAVPIVRRTVSGSSTLKVGDETLTPFTDFVPLPGRGTPASLDGVQAIFGGDMANPSITREQAAGKIVVLRYDTAASRGRSIRFGPGSPVAAAVAIAVALPSPPPSAAVAQARQGSLTMRGPGPARGGAAPLTLLVSPRAAGVLMGAPLQDLAPGTAGRTVAGNIAYEEMDAPARNVVAILRGSDPKLRGEYVAIGAHSDHIGLRLPAVDHDSLRAYDEQRWLMQQSLPAAVRAVPDSLLARIHVNVDSLHRLHSARMDSVNNGADDDGSGSIAALELAEAFARGVRPRRSILFVWHTGEELGLVGSRWYTDHPTVPRDSIVAQLNMDMIGRGDAGDIRGGGPAYLQLVGSRRLSTELGDLVEAVNRTEPAPFRFDYQYDAPGHPENIYCRSDHAEYARFGIPITFFTTGLHEDYHQVTDEAEYIDYDHLARVTRLVHDVALRVGNLGHRVVVDKPKPDPSAPCRQ